MIRILAVALVGFVLTLPSAHGAEPSREGEDAVVIVKDAPLQKGLDILVRVPSGMRVPVLKSRDGWAKVRYSAGATTHEGWIDERHLAPAVTVDRTKARKLPEHLARLAVKILDQDLREDDKDLKSEDPAKILANFKETVAALKELAEQNPREFRTLAADALTEVEWFGKVMRSIQEHPDFAGLKRDSDSSFSFKQSGPLPRVEFTERTIAPNESLNALKARLFHSIDELRGLALRTAAQVRKESGPVLERGQALGVDFAASFPFEGKRFFDPAFMNPFDNPDRLRLTNASGVTLTNCVVEVKIVGAKETRHNVHFVPKWPAGQVRIARCYQGFESGNKQVIRTTAADVERIEVSISSEELRQDTIKYQYDAREKEIAFRHCIERASIAADCDRYVGLLENGYRIRVSFENVPCMPDGTLKTRVKRNGVWTEQETKIDKWRSGREESIDFADIKSTDVKPTEYEVELDVRYEKYTCKRVFTAKP